MRYARKQRDIPTLSEKSGMAMSQSERGNSSSGRKSTEKGVITSVCGFVLLHERCPFSRLIALHNIYYEACIKTATLVLRFYPSKEAKMRNCTVKIPRLPYSYLFIVATDEWEHWRDYLSELSFVVSVTRSQETNDIDTYLHVSVSPRADAIEMQTIETIKALGQPMRHSGHKDEKEKICYSMYFWDTEIIRIYHAPGIVKDPPRLMSKIIDFLIEMRSP